jgi:crotonobetainyl-CoA:carnitine CoA-transferase CaiB-like acyl-CoA transferase
LVEVTLTGDANANTSAKLPGLPIEFGGERCGLRHDLPKEGEHSKEAAKAAGFADDEIEALIADGIIRVS